MTPISRHNPTIPPAHKPPISDASLKVGSVGVMAPPLAVDVWIKPEAISDIIVVDDSALEIIVVLFTPAVTTVVVVRATVVVLLQRTHAQRELVLGQTKQLKSLCHFEARYLKPCREKHAPQDASLRAAQLPSKSGTHGWRQTSQAIAISGAVNRVYILRNGHMLTLTNIRATKAARIRSV
jgi:hypothetical protein